ncbi:MAG: peptidoglycan-binding protein [Leptospirales bacterium]|nr:peptidoglycan-binding protein [Leptospirales bacterium]
MKEYKVNEGESIKSIAYNNGFYWKTIWDHPDNKELKELRKNPEILYADDIVVIPDKEIRKEKITSNELHKFKVKGSGEMFQMRFLLGDKPMANVSYTLYIDKKFFAGKTDEEGWVKKPTHPNARVARVYLGDEEDEDGNLLETDEYIFNLGHLDPIDTISGIQGRLNNLGYNCGEEDGEIGENTINAIKGFQNKNGLSATGVLNDMTRKKIQEVYGC